MAINTNKKIKKVSYNQTVVSSGVDPSNVTASIKDVLPSKIIIDSNGNYQRGQLPLYVAQTSYNFNTTVRTGGKYVPDDILIKVDAGGRIYRHLNPTIIRVDLRGLIGTNVGLSALSLPYTMTIKIKQVSGAKAFKMNWGDGTEETISTSTSTQTKTHSYTSPGIYNIVFSPDSQNDNRFTLLNADENTDILTFDSYMFGQSSNSPLQIPISVYCGDSAWFSQNSLSYCSYIDVLSFENMSSLLEKSASGSISEAYYTQDFLATAMCRYSTIWTLIIGSSVNELKTDCFSNSTVWDLIVIDARGTGISTAPITITSSSLPTVANKIHINHLRLNTYKQASYWSAKSSQMIGY